MSAQVHIMSAQVHSMSTKVHIMSAQVHIYHVSSVHLSPKKAPHWIYFTSRQRCGGYISALVVIFDLYLVDIFLIFDLYLVDTFLLQATQPWWSPPASFHQSTRASNLPASFSPRPQLPWWANLLVIILIIIPIVTFPIFEPAAENDNHGHNS